MKGAELLLEGRNGEPPRTRGAMGREFPALSGGGVRLSRGSWRVFPGESLAGGCARRTRDELASAAELAWDLFAGVGLFARQLAGKFAQVVAVESAPAAMAALSGEFARTRRDRCEGTTLDFLRGTRGRTSGPILIVVDPPRTGLGAETTELLAKIAAPALVYVSCDPATLARDLRRLSARAMRSRA